MQIVVIVLGVVLFFILLDCWQCSHALDFTHIEIPVRGLPAGFDGFRICHLSDFHCARYGDNSRELAEGILAWRPDCIMVTGDMADSGKDRGARYFFSVLERLKGEFPVYCSLGNHEKRIGGGKAPLALCGHLAQAGAVVLDDSRLLLEHKGDTLWLYGYLQPFARASGHYRRARLRQDVTVKDVQKALGPCPRESALLLAHDPAPFATYAGWGAALTLSGHVHGGMIRLPFVGGLFSPARRFFPRYDAGLYQMGGGRLYVSRGIGRSTMPRFRNRGEVVFITLRKEEGEECAQ